MSEETKQPGDSGSVESHCSLRAMVIARLGGVGAMSRERYGECLRSIARECGRVVDTEFRSEVNQILRDLPCPLD